MTNTTKRNPAEIAAELQRLHDAAHAQAVAPDHFRVAALNQEWLQATNERLQRAGLLADDATGG